MVPIYVLVFGPELVNMVVQGFTQAHGIKVLPSNLKNKESSKISEKGPYSQVPPEQVQRNQVKLQTEQQNAHLGAIIGILSLFWAYVGCFSLFWGILSLFWVFLAYFGAYLAYFGCFEPFLELLWVFLTYFGAFGTCQGSFRGCFRLIMASFLDILGLLGPILGCLAYLWTFLAYLGLFWDVFSLLGIIGYFELLQITLSHNWGPRPNFGPFLRVCALISPISVGPGLNLVVLDYFGCIMVPEFVSPVSHPVPGMTRLGVESRASPSRVGTSLDRQSGDSKRSPGSRGGVRSKTPVVYVQGVRTCTPGPSCNAISLPNSQASLTLRHE